MTSTMLLLSPYRQPPHAHSMYSSRHGPPKIIVKKEPPSSPEVTTTSRHRPRKLDLSSSTSQSLAQMPARPSGSLTARESAGLGSMVDVGLACLSPGFQTQDPTMQQQLQRSISVRDQQRHIIESRLQKTAKPTDPDARSTMDNPFGAGMKTPSTSKKRPPNGLSIVPPSHEQFANERVIQSAPLHQSFTGRHQPPLTRHIANQPSNLSNTSHIHHVPATQPATGYHQSRTFSLAMALECTSEEMAIISPIRTRILLILIIGLPSHRLAFLLHHLIPLHRVELATTDQQKRQ